MTPASVAALGRMPGPVAWVFTGGGARAAAQTGMAEVLLEQGLRPDLLVGSSTGALTAAALIDPRPPLSGLRQAWQLIGTESVLASLGSAAVRAFAPRRTGRSVREYREFLSRVLPGDPHVPIPPGLTLVASDLRTGASVCLTTGPLIDALLAAATVPVIFPPVERDGMLLLDGGLTAAAPLDQALAAGAASIVLFDTGASAVSDEAVAQMRWWQVAGLAYGHQIRGQLGHALVRVAERVPIVTLSTDSGGQLDFTEPDETMVAGRSVASAALAHGWAGPVSQPGLYGTPVGFDEDPRLMDLIRS